MGVRFGSFTLLPERRPTTRDLAQKLEDIEQLATSALTDPFIHRGHTLTAIREIARRRR